MVFVVVSIVSIACGLVMLVAGYVARYARPIEDRVDVGLARISIGIVAMATPMAYAIGWVAWQIISAFGAIATA